MVENVDQQSHAAEQNVAHDVEVVAPESTDVIDLDTDEDLVGWRKGLGVWAKRDIQLSRGVQGKNVIFWPSKFDCSRLMFHFLHPKTTLL